MTTPMPERVQLRRTKGWRMPPNTVVVARPSKWGNPWTAGAPHPIHGWPMSRDEAAECFAMAFGVAPRHGLYVPLLPDSYPSREQIAAELRGKNLACWCPLDQSCHADVLLEVANS